MNSKIVKALANYKLEELQNMMPQEILIKDNES